MSREWKPGDVALVRDRRRSAEVGFCIAGGRVGGDIENMARWRVASGEVWSSVIDARPLVVIDPEDREAARRLLETYGRQFTAWEPELDSNVTRLQAALREFANPTPPRPDEPTNPAARITDRRDNIWRLLADGDWVCTCGPDIGEYLTWSRLAAERGPLTEDGAA